MKVSTSSVTKTAFSEGGKTVCLLFNWGFGGRGSWATTNEAWSRVGDSGFLLAGGRLMTFLTLTGNGPTNLGACLVDSSRRYRSQVKRQLKGIETLDRGAQCRPYIDETVAPLPVQLWLCMMDYTCILFCGGKDASLCEDDLQLEKVCQNFQKD